jgi:hypothetical protein
VLSCQSAGSFLDGPQASLFRAAFAPLIDWHNPFCQHDASAFQSDVHVLSLGDPDLTGRLRHVDHMAPPDPHVTDPQAVWELHDPAGPAKARMVDGEHVLQQETGSGIQMCHTPLGLSSDVCTYMGALYVHNGRPSLRNQFLGSH